MAIRVKILETFQTITPYILENVWKNCYDRLEYREAHEENGFIQLL